MFCHYCIQSVKDGTQIRVYKINKENVADISQFISVKVGQYLRKSQAQLQEKLRKLRLRKNYRFLIKNVYLSNVLLMKIKTMKLILPSELQLRWFQDSKNISQKQ